MDNSTNYPTLAGWRAGSLESGYKQHTRRRHQQRAQTTNNSLDVQRKRTRLSKERIYYNQETPTQYEYQYNNSINGPGGGDRGLITAAQAQTLSPCSPRVFALKVVVDDPLNNNITKVISGNGRDGSIDRSFDALFNVPICVDDHDLQWSWTGQLTGLRNAHITK